MAKFRMKQLWATEWEEFRSRFETLFLRFGEDPRMALWVSDPQASEKVAVLIPFFRSGLVETLSPGGWSDRTGEPSERWKLAVGTRDSNVGAPAPMAA